MRAGTWAAVLTVYGFATGCGGTTAPTEPTPVQVVTPSSATITVSGSVRNATSSAPVSGATVQVASGPDLTRSATTDASGNYSLTGLRVGIFSLRFRHDAFEVVERTVNALQDTRVDVQLRQGSACMAPPAVTGLRATVAGSRVSFSWNPASGATSYLIVIGTAPGSSNTLSATTQLTTFQWRGATNGTYYSRVFSRGDCPHDSVSSEITFRVGT